MPIYEFYCPDCHRVFSFLSRTINTEKRPSCPRCQRAGLERKVSPFAISRGRPEPAEDGMPDLDDAQMEQAMMALASEAEDLDEDDPRQMAHLMRKLHDATGMKLSPPLEEAMRRMESGEDPEKIEEEMGDLLDDDPFMEQGSQGLKGLRRQLSPPSVDETLYEL